jgi:hypothetical protein
MMITCGRFRGAAWRTEGEVEPLWSLPAEFSLQDELSRIFCVYWHARNDVITVLQIRRVARSPILSISVATLARVRSWATFDLANCRERGSGPKLSGLLKAVPAQLKLRMPRSTRPRPGLRLPPKMAASLKLSGCSHNFPWLPVPTNSPKHFTIAALAYQILPALWKSSAPSPMPSTQRCRTAKAERTLVKWLKWQRPRRSPRSLAQGRTASLGQHPRMFSRHLQIWRRISSSAFLPKTSLHASRTNA